MRILQICSAKTIGGGERHLVDLSNRLQTRGHEVFAALAPQSPLANLLKLPPENLITAQIRNALDIRNIRSLYGFVRQKEIEIIHAHTGRDYLPTALCSELSSKPYVITRHVLFPMKRANRFFLRGASGVIAVSNAVSRTLSQQRIFPADKIKVIYNGVDTLRFSPSAKKENDTNTFRVGALGELSALKAHEILIEAAAKVLGQKPHIEFEIVGEDKTPEQKRRIEIERILKESDLSSQVKLRGWLDDVIPFFHSLDVFVSTSRFDAFGLVIAEAMSCGIPVIAADTAAAREIIEHEENGILFPTDDADALADAILDLLENPAKREHLANAGRKRIETAFSLENMVERTEEFYQNVISRL